MAFVSAPDTVHDAAVDAADDHWTRKAMAIVALCFALNMADGMDVLVVSFIAPSLQNEWGVSPAELAIVFSTGLAGMALGGLGLAPMADRFGRRRMVALAMALMAVAMAVSSLTHSVMELAIVRFFIGTGIGTVLACISAIAARVAPRKHRNFAVGVLQAGYPIGAMFTGFITAWALPIFGWHAILLGTAAVSALLVPVILSVLPAGLDAGAQGQRPALPKWSAARAAPIRSACGWRRSAALWRSISSPAGSPNFRSRRACPRRRRSSPARSIISAPLPAPWR
jgi:MFS family permease